MEWFTVRATRHFTLDIEAERLEEAREEAMHVDYNKWDELDEDPDKTTWRRDVIDASEKGDLPVEKQYTVSGLRECVEGWHAGPPSVAELLDHLGWLEEREKAT